MNKIQVKCPAKINLTLEIVNKRTDGFHNIKSVMQTINLYDFLTIEAEVANDTKINLFGNSTEIPYDKSNLVYMAADLFLNAIGQPAKVHIYIEKNIPIAAGLAGGSTDAAGIFWGLNKIFNYPLSTKELHELCSTLGSDLNVCLEGGTLLATSRGEKIEKLKTIKMPVTLIKPKNIGISAREAYLKYAQKNKKPKYNKTEKLIDAIQQQKDIKDFLYNDLEYAVSGDYKELQYIKEKLPNAIMSGSGSTYFVLEHIDNNEFPENYQVITGLEFVSNGVC